ncbi:MAG TPA: anthranilate phosphoribosyltransferase [Mycobacteriales bacterium]|jgi:anthranilate phosphoribosyltransferase|nr:anthranilate phosphoribosyltransferase [Mycobacteriales bacterium]
MSFKELLTALIHGENLTSEQTTWAMSQIITGQATEAQIAGLAVALRTKGETPDEVDGLVAAMLAHMTPMTPIPAAVDVVGTGGDGANTVNISTMAALVAAGAGATVVKHGNRSASSKCGSADVLEALGVQLERPAGQIATDVTRCGIGFCYARQFHPGLRHAAPVRAQLGVPTVFNFLGPLSNPARPLALAVGCADAAMAPILAHVLARRGTTALVMRGDDGLDEFTTTDATRIWLVSHGTVREAKVDAVQLGIARAARGDLTGGGADTNAAAVRRMLAGEGGPVRDAAVINAAAAIAAYRGFGDVPPSDTELHDALRRAVADAEAAIDTGAAKRVLDAWVAGS